MQTFDLVNLDTSINVEQFIAEFNIAQSSFKLRNCKNDFNLSSRTLSKESFFDHFGKIIENNQGVTHVIGITKKPLENNFFTHESKDNRMAIISLYQSEIYSPPFSNEDYLKLAIVSSILLMLSKVSIGHKQTLGCLFDFCANKKDVVVKLHTGAICSDCKAKLLYNGLTDAEVMAGQKILWEISKDFISIRVNRGCPIGHKSCKEFHDIRRNYSDKNIFIAISFGKEFQNIIDNLKTALRELGFELKIVNEEIANKSVLCKICNTIQTCKYGIAEFSGFRHNVSYEFGLMQAFGLETIGIIKKEKLHELDRKMSDMKGIEVIPYQNEAEDLLAKLQKFLNS